MWSRKPDERLSILRACDHFREWQSLDDRRICVVCDRSFNGHEVQIVMIGNDYKLHCPTAACESGVHQWVYPGNPLRALGSTESGPEKPRSFPTYD